MEEMSVGVSIQTRTRKISVTKEIWMKDNLSIFRRSRRIMYLRPNYAIYVVDLKMAPPAISILGAQHFPSKCGAILKIGPVPVVRRNRGN